MVQRIQTMYLAVGAAALVGMLFFSVIWQGAATEQAWFTPAVLILSILAAAVAVGAIFLFKDRQRQRKAIVAAQGVTVVLLLVFCGGLYLADALYVRTAQGMDVSLLGAILLPVAAYLLFLLARRSIDKDIELVRSMDRLR